MQTVIKNALEKNNLPISVDVEEYETLPDVYASSIAKYGNKPAFSCMGQTITFNELKYHAEAFAAFLQDQGLKPGDRLAIQMPNVLQYPVALYGALLAGVVVVNTNPLYTASELNHQLQDSGATAVVVLANFAHTLEKIIYQTDIKTVIVSEIADLHDFPKRTFLNLAVKYIKKMVPAYNLPGHIKFRDALNIGRKHMASKPFTAYQARRDQLALLQFTGGTTGVAKGAMLSHGNLIANCIQSRSLFKNYLCNEGSEISFAPLPLYHIYSFTLGLVMIEFGSHTVLIPNPRDLDSIVDAIKKHGITFFTGINTLFNALCNHDEFKKQDFSKLKVTLSGGMALTENCAKRWQEITGCEIYQGYGLTETSPIVSGNPREDNRPSSIGLPIPNTEVKLIDDDGFDVAIDEKGELCVRGPQVMTGYWQRPEATAETIDDEGWLKTGDMAKIDADGFLYIVDRKKDMIIVSGFNVYPNEVEDVLSLHPGISECAVIGIPDEDSGEAVKAFVVKKDPSLTEQEIIAYSRNSLTGYKTPDVVEFIDELPKSTVGKILRKELRKREEEKAA